MSGALQHEWLVKQNAAGLTGPLLERSSALEALLPAIPRRSLLTSADVLVLLFMMSLCNGIGCSMRARARGILEATFLDPSLEKVKRRENAKHATAA